MDELDKSYWERRHTEGQTQWDIGYVSTPLKEYFDQLKDKTIAILIPGCGNAYEGEYLLQQGFDDVNLIDISETSMGNFKKRVPQFPEKQLFCEDFFKHKGQYDLIVEQTFFCALDPSLRVEYARKMRELLKPGGRLVGLLFDDGLNKDHPPFGGNKEEYLGCFEPYFEIEKFEKAYNSIKPRRDREFFVLLKKPL